MTRLWTFPRRSLITWAGGLVLAGCGDDAPDPTESGAPAPTWTLTDVQPLSAGYGESYGLEAFHGSPLLVALLAGSCNTCVGIAAGLETLLQELLAEGLSVSFCAVNEATDLNPQLLTDVCTFPVFQDDAATGAWAMHGGGRDDLFVYSSGATLVQFFDFPSGEPSGNPTSAEGRANLRSALMSGM